MSDAFKPLVESDQSPMKSFVSYKNVSTVEGQDCELSPIDITTADRDFTALQYALFVSLFVQVRKDSNIRLLATYQSEF